MNETRKKIIINEVHYWKQNRLLPEHYCNYLLALYNGSDGNEHGESRLKGKKPRMGIPAVIAFFSTGLTVYVNYFTELRFNMQTLLTIFFLLTSGAAAYRAKITDTYLQVSMVCMALSFLILTVKITEIVFAGESTVFYPLLLVHCGLWIFAGKKYNMAYFTSAAVLGACIIAYFYLKTWNFI